jgi:hypothetical protein
MASRWMIPGSLGTSLNGDEFLGHAHAAGLRFVLRVCHRHFQPVQNGFTSASAWGTSWLWQPGNAGQEMAKPAPVSAMTA